MYSQFDEDGYIAGIIRDQKLNITPFIIDLGAFDGKTLSNSRLFFEMGWSGICVEAHPKTFEKLIGNNCNFNGYCINMGVSDKNEILYITDHENIPEQNRLTSDPTGIKVETLTYQDILEITEHKDQPIGILSIDIEGYDTRVLKDVIKHKYQPEFIITESHTMNDRRDQIALLQNYHLLNILDFNNIFVRRDIATWIPEC